jgi:hypothetical protein
VPVLSLPHEGTAFSQDAVRVPVDALPVMRDEVVESHAPEFLERVAERALQRRVGIEDSPILHIYDKDVLGSLLQGPPEAFLALAQRTFGSASLGYVPCVQNDALYDGVFKQIRTDDLEVTPAAFTVPGTEFGKHTWLRLLHKRRELFPNRRKIVGMNLGKYAGAGSLSGAKTEDPLDGGTLVEDHSIGVEDHYYVRRVTHEGPESLFASPEGLFRQATLGYISGVDA